MDKSDRSSGAARKKKLVYDDTKLDASKCRQLGATGSLVGRPAQPAASRRLPLEFACRCAPLAAPAFSRWLLPLEQALSSTVTWLPALP